MELMDEYESFLIIIFIYCKEIVIIFIQQERGKSKMNANIKGQIDFIENETKTTAELEQTIILLRNEDTNLKITINKLNETIQNLKEELKNQQLKFPKNIEILKDIIVTQRRDLNEKEKELETSKILIEKFTGELEDTITHTEYEFLITDIPGIGLKTAEKLYNYGICKIKDLHYCEIDLKAKEITGLSVKKLNKWKQFLINRENKLGVKYIS